MKRNISILEKINICAMTKSQCIDAVFELTKKRKFFSRFVRNTDGC